MGADAEPRSVGPVAAYFCPVAPYSCGSLRTSGAGAWSHSREAQSKDSARCGDGEGSGAEAARAPEKPSWATGLGG